MTLRRDRGDDDAKYALTKARQERQAGQGGRGDDGEDASELDWAVVQQRRHASGWSTVAAMASVVALVRRVKESSERDMKLK